MTNTVAENYVNQSIEVMTESITNSTNQCSTSVSTNQFNIINGGNSSNCTINSSANIKTTVDMSCYASTDVQNSVQNNLQQAAKQAAESVNQQFGLLAFSEAINISNSYIGLANTMNTIFYNSCITEISSNQTNVVNCQGSENMTVDIDFNNTTELTQDCIFNNNLVNETANNISQSIAQSAKAEIENWIAGIFAAILGVIIAAGIVLFLIFLIFRVSSNRKPTEVNPDTTSNLDSGEDILALAERLRTSQTMLSNLSQSKLS